jgi:hypothetical protein
VKAYYLQRTRFERIAERKLRRRQLTEDENVEISGRNLQVSVGTMPTAEERLKSTRSGHSRPATSRAVLSDGPDIAAPVLDLGLLFERNGRDC